MASNDPEAAAYESTIEFWAARPPQPVRTTVSLEETLRRFAGVTVVDKERMVRARSWNVRLDNGSVVKITDQDSPDTIREKLQEAGANPGLGACPECLALPLDRPRTPAEVDALIERAGGLASIPGAEFSSVEKDRTFEQRAWMVQFSADALYRDTSQRIDSDEEVFVPREFVAQALLRDGDSDEQAVESCRLAWAALAGRVARGAPQEALDKALEFSEVSACPACQGTGRAA